MDRQKFIKNLEEFYQKQKTIVATRLDEWLELNMKESDLADFFKYVTEENENKSFPALSKLRKMAGRFKSIRYNGSFRSNSNNKVNDYLRAKMAQWEKISTWPNVIEAAKMVRNAKKSQNIMATNLLCEWQDLLTEFEVCESLKFPESKTLTHLRDVRKSIIEGKPINRIIIEKRQVDMPKPKKVKDIIK